MNEDFTLNERLAAETVLVGDLPLCRVLLKDDRRFPWLMLVPRRADIAELIDLGDEDRAQAFAEIVLMSRVMRRLFQPDKLNTAAIGNLVAQLHIHLIARYHSDAAWPAPTFGFGKAEPYPPHVLGVLIDRLAGAIEAEGPAATPASDATP